MSSNTSRDPLAAAKQAQRDLNSYQAKQGLNTNSDSGIRPLSSYPSVKTQETIPDIPSPIANESGVNEYLPSPPLPFFPPCKLTHLSQIRGERIPQHIRNLRQRDVRRRR
jgi:hypothetical protein